MNHYKMNKYVDKDEILSGFNTIIDENPNSDETKKAIENGTLLPLVILAVNGKKLPATDDDMRTIGLFNVVINKNRDPGLAAFELATMLVEPNQLSNLENMISAYDKEEVKIFLDGESYKGYSYIFE